MTDYGGKIGEILHELSRFVAFSCRFRCCSDHRIARHGTEQKPRQQKKCHMSSVLDPSRLD